MSESTRRRDLPSRLRHGGIARWLAIVLLLFQVVLTADHLGAAAAASFGRSATEDAIGILALCHGDGSIDFAAPVDDEAPPTAPVPPCVLCASVALAGVGVISVAPVVTSPAPVVLAESPPPTVVAGVTVRSPLRYGTVRGPPPALV